jgi:hypothetical protein
MVCNRVAVQTCLSLLIAAGAAHASDSEAQDRTSVPGVEIWLGTNRVTPPRTSELPTPRRIEPMMTDQAVSLRSRTAGPQKKGELAFQSLPTDSNVPVSVPSGDRNQQDAGSSPVSDTIPVWRLPSRPGSSGVETRLSGAATTESTKPSAAVRAIALSEIGDLPSDEAAGSIGEAIRLLKESIELNQRAAEILKSLTPDTDCVGCSFEQAVETPACPGTLPVPSMLPKANSPARAISAILTDSPHPGSTLQRRDQPNAEMKRQEAVNESKTWLQICDEDIALQLMTFSPPVLRRPGLREVVVLVVALLLAVAMLEGITRFWRGCNGWPLWSLRQPRAESRVANDNRRDETKTATAGAASDLVAAVIAQNVRLRRQLVEV